MAIENGKPGDFYDIPFCVSIADTIGVGVKRVERLWNNKGEKIA